MQLEIETTKEVVKQSLNVFSCPFDRSNLNEYTITDVTFLVNEKIRADLMLEFQPYVTASEIEKADWSNSLDIDYDYEYKWVFNCPEKINAAIVVPKSTDELNLDGVGQQMNDIHKFMRACVSIGIKDGFVSPTKIKCIWNLVM